MEQSKQLDASKWIDLYADQLFAYAFSRVQDREVAEDLVQESFLSAWKSRDTYKGEASEKNWLYQICKNKIIDYYRSKKRSAIVEQDNSEKKYFDDSEHWATTTGPRDWQLNYQLPIEQKEFYSILESCKKKLKELQQEVFVLKYMEELDASRICQILGISNANYWVLIHRAKLQLRACLEKNWINI